MTRTRLKYLIALGLILTAQLADLTAVEPDSSVGPPDFLRSAPSAIDGWQPRQEARFDEDVLGALAPDEYLVRYYGRETALEPIELMIAYFRSQAEGFGPHSPKVCLPAAGWEPVAHKVIQIPDGQGDTFAVNRYHLRSGRDSRLVLYWYHSRSRATAGEIEARLWLAWDTLVSRRHDISLVRIVLPFAEGGEADAVHAATGFASAAYRDLRQTWRPR